MDSSLPVSKRRNSNTPAAILPSPIPFRPSHSPAFRKTSKKPLIGDGDLHRRPSHPTLGVEGLAGHGDDLGFLLRTSLPAVDFNRPPSQLSLYAPLDGGDNDGEALDQRLLAAGEPWVYNERFEAELQDTSTPNKRDPASQHVSLELQTLSSQTALISKAAVRRSPALEDRTLNMSLTSVEDNRLTEGDDFANRSPWISDSIISPPSIYLRRNGAPEGQGISSPAYADESSTTLRTDFGDGDLTENFEIELDANASNHVAESKETNGETAISRDTLPAETGEPRQLFGRTRSGTVVAPAPAVSVPATGRARSGTITAAPAAIKQGRGRSGTITQSSSQRPPMEMKPMFVTGRSRSGTITTAQPCISTVASLAPILDSGLPVPEAHVETLAPGVNVLIDAQYDPTPSKDLVFSPAPNPDMEAESDDEVELGFHPAIISPPPSPFPGTGLRPCPTSSPDPLNIDPANPDVGLNRAWVHAKAKATGKKALSKRSGSKKADSKGSKKLNLKKTLGFNSTRRGRKYAAAGESSTESSPEREEITTLSSDPMDFVIGFEPPLR
ncbi:hypothetical protein H1R20_g453, partial [Candolleomyces eurysporus]